VAPPFPTLAADLERRFDAGVGSPWPEHDFEALALAAFRVQFEAVDPYRSFCEGRGCTPATVRRWQDVPAVPATAFKHIDFGVESGRAPERTFRTSGTTRGAEACGRHLVPRVSLYRHSLLPPFRAHLLGGRERMRFASLVPSPAARPDSSLSFMVGAAADAYATRTHWLVGSAGALDLTGWSAAARDAERAAEPVLVVGTSLALLHLVERLESEPAPPLPSASRIMETGGFKGSGREVERGELHARVEAATGVPSARIVGEYGMTELLSQLYEPVLREGALAHGTYVAPPWLRVRALDPMTLAEVPVGAEGILAFFDLANAGSICHVLTEDVGSVGEGRVRLAGRARGAEPRGCSLAMDELLSAARSAP
jgi:hypothetical protein